MAFSPSPSPDISLPNEIWTAVFESLESPDLVSVTCVSRRLGAVAERILYSDIQICETISSGQFPCKTNACCKTIIRRLHLVEYVKHLHIRWTIRSSNVAWHLQSVLFNLSNTLRTLAFLESLDLSLDLSKHVSGEFDILRQCRLPSLCHLSLSGVGCTAVECFLNRTPSIQHLKLLDYHLSLVLFPDALPSLNSFCGPPRIAATVVPGRPVQYLALSGHTSEQQGWLDAVRGAMPMMMLSTAPIRYLDLSNSSMTLILLRDISEFFSDLEVLKVRFALRHALHFSSSGIVRDIFFCIKLCQVECEFFREYWKA